MNIKIFEPQELDFERYALLQKLAFAELFKSAGVSNNGMNPDYYLWKYAPPAGKAKIATVFEGDAMVAANAMIPLLIKRGNSLIKGWQSCDTATIPKARGKGYFSACLQALKEEIAANQIFFGFPNKNSQHGFIKIGWEEKALIPALVSVNIVLKRWNSDAILEIRNFSELPDRFFQNLTNTNDWVIYRDSAYLNWRYRQHPVFAYDCFGFRAQNRAQGFIVVRQAAIKGHKIALVMDLWGLNARIRNALLAYIQSYFRKQGIWFSFMLTNCFSPCQVFSMGCIPIPFWLLPKKQVLMGSCIDNSVTDIMKKKWQLQLGDWDAF